MAAPATTPTVPLSPADLTTIRTALANNRRPKVVFTRAAGQIAGQTGQVVELTDPADSDEWIVVRFGRDELPFSPTDLALPGRAGAAVPARTATARRTSVPAPAPTPEPEFVLDSAPTRGGRARRPEPGDATARDAGPARTPAPADNPPTPAPTERTTRMTAAVAPETTGAPAPAESAPKPARPTKVKPPASLVVTLSYTEREWTIAAVQGSKSLAKPYVIKPAEALRMVALVDVPGVHEAVESIIAAERAEAEGRAERLRAELAELESRLAELTGQD